MNQDVLSGLESHYPAAAVPGRHGGAPRTSLLPFGIAGRLTLWTAVIGFAVIGSITLYMFSRSADLLRAREQAAMSSTLDSVELRLNARLAGARGDAQFFAHASAVLGIGRAIANGGIDPADGRSLQTLSASLADLFAAMLASRPQYAELRFVGVAGQVVDMGRRPSGDIEAFPPRPDSAVDREVIRQASTLPAGATYTGSLDPHAQMSVQLAAPAYDKAGTLLGVTIVHLGLAQLFNTVDEQFRGTMSLHYVADEQGAVLEGPDDPTVPAKEELPGGPLGDGAALGAIFSGDGASSGVVSFGRDAYLTAVRRVHFDPQLPMRFVAIAELRSEALLLADITALRNQTLLVASAGLLLGLALVVWLARFISLPLRRMTGLAAEVAAGRPAVDLSDLTRRDDETGELARAFDHMLRVIDLRETELARQAEELQRSNNELSQFAYVASHDLQEPLRMVASYLELLRRRYQGELDAEADEFIGFAVDGATRMKALINDVLGYARVSNVALARRSIDLGVVARSAAAVLGHKVEAVGAVLEFGELPVLEADPATMERLFSNLIDNAVKYHGAVPPRIVLSGRRVGEFWEISVADNGIGIAPEFRDKVFEIFARLHSRDKYEGTGIGLAACRRIVERHGGRIWVTEAPGGGSVFTFALPAAPEKGTDDAGG